MYFIQKLPCVRCGEGPCANHHDPTKGAGGTYTDISPLCHTCHQRRHNVGAKTFWLEVGMSYEESNARTHEAWDDTLDTDTGVL